MDLQDIIKALDDLGPEDRRYLLDTLERLVGRDKVLAELLPDLREAKFAKGVICPRCGGSGAKRNGTYRGRQRYLCRCCGRTFNDLTGTPMAGTHYPELWLNYLRAMVEGRTLPGLAEELGIHISTAFYWRHKILRAIRKLKDGGSLSGIVEADETYFLESQKGSKNLICRKHRKRGGKASKKGVSQEQVAVLAAVDRNAGIVCRKAGRGRLKVGEVAAVIAPAIAADATLCTDGTQSFARFATNAGLAHEKVVIRKGRPADKGIYHLQRVNNYPRPLEIMDAPLQRGRHRVP